MVSWHQFLLALVFLTRLPLARALPPQTLRLAQGAWAFPLVGVIVGVLGSIPLMAGGPGLLPAVLSVGVSVWLTGALHEDALADFSDAAGGTDAQTRLAIMRDSRIGSYGVMALVLTTSLRVAALALLGPLQLIAAAACGRVAIVLAMAGLPPARTDGLGCDAGQPGWRSVVVAMLLGLLVLLPAGPGGVTALIAGLFAAGFVIRQARRWLGGQTGDVLGAVSVLTETAMLVAFALVTGH